MNWPPGQTLPSNAALVPEDYIHDPMPPGFRVVISELEGPVFADAAGHTVYIWPLKGLRNDNVGEPLNKPACTDRVEKESAGLMGPYGGGLELPEAEKRHSCAQEWPPVLATAKARPMGKWTIATRPDGTRQWAYEGYSLYTSILDRQPGDTNGAWRRPFRIDAPAYRVPVGPRPNVPAQFAIAQVTTGRILTTIDGFSVYTSDKDQPNKSNCDMVCTREWTPVPAAERAQAQGEFSILVRSPGIRQWAFRKKPLYRHNSVERLVSLDGSDLPGWHNVYTQVAPRPPQEFTMQRTRSGLVLADAKGKTMYLYNCGEDTADQLSCDHPDNTQAYRFAVCGGFDPKRCLETFPYVIAQKDARSTSHLWSVIDIDWKTGRRAASNDADTLHVWAYRGRPVYTFADDQEPGDVEADSWGEFNGQFNGFKAFWLRDLYFDNNQ